LPDCLRPIPHVQAPPNRKQHDTSLNYIAAKLSWEINQTPNRIKTYTPRAALLYIFGSLLKCVFTNSLNDFIVEVVRALLIFAAIFGAFYSVDWIFEYVKKTLWSGLVQLTFTGVIVVYYGWVAVVGLSIFCYIYGFYLLLRSWVFDFNSCSTRIASETIRGVNFVQTLLQKTGRSDCEYVSSVEVDENVEYKPASAKCIFQQRDTGTDSDDDPGDNYQHYLRFYLYESLLAGAKVSQRGFDKYPETGTIVLEVVS